MHCNDYSAVHLYYRSLSNHSLLHHSAPAACPPFLSPHSDVCLPCLRLVPLAGQRLCSVFVSSPSSPARRWHPINGAGGRRSYPFWVALPAPCSILNCSSSHPLPCSWDDIVGWGGGAGRGHTSMAAQRMVSGNHGL